jgi:hypothetical protein
VARSLALEPNDLAEDGDELGCAIRRLAAVGPVGTIGPQGFPASFAGGFGPAGVALHVFERGPGLPGLGDVSLKLSESERSSEHFPRLVEAVQLSEYDSKIVERRALT